MSLSKDPPACPGVRPRLCAAYTDPLATIDIQRVPSTDDIQPFRQRHRNTVEPACGAHPKLSIAR